jgi:hypothetical protein
MQALKCNDTKNRPDVAFYPVTIWEGRVNGDPG